MKRVLVLAVLTFVLVGCRVHVDSYWPGTGQARTLTVTDGEHIDWATTGPFDDACATVGPPSPCQDFGWAQPVNTYWEHRTYRQCFGTADSCTWSDVGDVWWYAWCGYYWPSYECVHTFYPRVGFHL